MALLEILRHIGQKPMMYIGDPPGRRVSIWHLNSFFVGYQCSNRNHPPADDDFILDSLTFWICLRYRILDSMNWAGLLWRQAGEDDEAAFKLFFELFEDYVRDRLELGPEVIKARFMAMAQQIARDEKAA